MKTVIDVYGRSVTVDDSRRTLYDYCNRAGLITYNAPIIEDGKTTRFYTDYVEHGTVDSIEDRLEKWNNAVKCAYGLAVGCNADENDPDRSLWRAYVAHVKANPDKYFTKSGDFRKRLIIRPEDVAAARR